MSPNVWIVPIALLLMMAPLFAPTQGPVRDAIRDNYSEDNIEDKESAEGVEGITTLSSAPSSLQGDYQLYPVSAP